MSGWNFDISQAPRGRMVDQEVKNAAQCKAGITTVRVYEPDIILAASKCGKVMKSYFIPKENRWCMFASGELPIAWMPYPKHPNHVNFPTVTKE